MVGADSVQEKNTAGCLADKRLTNQQNRGMRGIAGLCAPGVRMYFAGRFMWD